MQQQTNLTSSKDAFTKLSEAQVGNWRLVQVEHKDDPHVTRMREMGFVPGAKLELLRKSKGGSPVFVRIGNLDVCCEESLADNFLVELQ